MKAVVATFNQEKALVGAFSVITNLQMELFEALLDTFDNLPFIIVDVELVVGLAGGDAGHEDGEEAAEEAGHPVQVVHAARVVDPQLGQQEGLQVSGGALCP